MCCGEGLLGRGIAQSRCNSLCEPAFWLAAAATRRSLVTFALTGRCIPMQPGSCVSEHHGTAIISTAIDTAASVRAAKASLLPLTFQRTYAAMHVCAEAMIDSHESNSHSRSCSHAINYFEKKYIY